MQCIYLYMYINTEVNTGNWREWMSFISLQESDIFKEK